MWHLFVLFGLGWRGAPELSWRRESYFGPGFCLVAKWLEKGRFTWPATKEGSVTLTQGQMSKLLEGISEYPHPRD
jgi:transposase